MLAIIEEMCAISTKDRKKLRFSVPMIMIAIFNPGAESRKIKALILGFVILSYVHECLGLFFKNKKTITYASKLISLDSDPLFVGIPIYIHNIYGSHLKINN
jgi:hypothetical protein